MPFSICFRWLCISTFWYFRSLLWKHGYKVVRPIINTIPNMIVRGRSSKTTPKNPKGRFIIWFATLSSTLGCSWSCMGIAIVINFQSWDITWYSPYIYNYGSIPAYNWKCPPNANSQWLPSQNPCPPEEVSLKKAPPPRPPGPPDPPGPGPTPVPQVPWAEISGNQGVYRCFMWCLCRFISNMLLNNCSFVFTCIWKMWFLYLVFMCFYRFDMVWIWSLHGCLSYCCGLSTVYL